MADKKPTKEDIKGFFSTRGPDQAGSLPRATPAATSPLEVGGPQLADPMTATVEALEEVGGASKGANEFLDVLIKRIQELADQKKKLTPEEEEEKKKKKEEKEAAKARAEALAKTKDGFAGIQHGLAALGMGMGMFQGLMGKIGGQIGSYVGMYNPAALKKFELASNDAMAALGSALVPVLGNFTEMLKGIGKIFVNLTPAGKALIAGLVAGTVAMTSMVAVTYLFSTAVNSATFGLSAVAGLIVGAFAGMAFAMKDTANVAKMMDKVVSSVTKVINGLGGALGPVVAAFTPVVDVLLEAFADSMGMVGQMLIELTPLFEILAQVLAAVLRVIVESQMGLMRAIGLKPADTNLKSAEGMAVRSVSTGSVESFVSKAYQSAFQLGKKEDPAVQTVNYLKQIETYVGKIVTWIERRLNAGGDAIEAASKYGGDMMKAINPGIAVGDALNKLITMGITGK